MSSDEGDDIEDLLGRLSIKLGWQNVEETALQKPSDSVKRKKKKKSVRSSSKKTPRRSRKDISSSSHKENNVNTCNRQNGNLESEGHVKGQAKLTRLLECQHQDRTLSSLDENSAREVRSSPSTDESSNCVNKTKDGDGSIQQPPPASRDKVAEDSDCSLQKSHPGTLNLESGQTFLKDEETFSKVSSVCESGDEESEHLANFNLDISPIIADTDGASSVVRISDNDIPGRPSFSSDDNADDFETKPDISHEECPSSRSKDEPEVPFSPLHHYSETCEPIRWILTPPPKNEPKKATPLEKVVMVTLSESDSDSSCDGDELLSLTERLAKNFRQQKSAKKPVFKKQQSGKDARLLCSSSSSEDSDSWKGHFTFRDKKCTQNTQSNARNPKVPKDDSSDDDDDFDSFLRAIKSSHPAPGPDSSNLQKSPAVDEDQYDASFIDDTPLDEGNDDDDVFYYRQINSDRKPARDKKKKIDAPVKTTPKFLNYRLPRFSESSDDDESVFATPIPPPLKTHKPKTTSSSKKSTPFLTPRKPTPGSTQTDFLVSLSTPRVGCVSTSPYVRDFKKQREILTRKLFTIYNQTVFDNKLPSDFNIKWNNRMRKTAGYCYYTKTRLGGQCNARIELSEKVCDTAERLRDTLIHELCHAACWLINGVNDGHGRFWKYWAAKANHAHPTIPVIKRCHSYEITTKYKYQCVTCKTTIGRHSKSINTDKFCCAYCKGSIVLLPPLNKDGKVAKVRTPNKFAMFVKENYGSVKKDNTSMKHADIMRLLSQDFSKKASVSV
ncbi:uncharacterized protein [Asterias amurensis]|uniref:uncharacterized protein isoform X1 n=1 Tax=Asterias amurensis TaxID=7602 RepID=UPI003AB5123C